LPSGTESDVRFPKAGVYKYYCTYHGTKDGKGMAGVVVVGDVAYSPSPRGGELKTVATPSGVTRKVPSQYPTIQSAVDAAQPGDLVLIDRGIYKEEVTVTTPSLVIRGVDRNETIVDGEFVRGNGVAVLADGVAIENMTARNAVLNGFYWTGVTGFRGSYLTAYNNGDYGIYSFGSHDGAFENSYASGSPDSGFYIGECFPCRIVVRNVVAEHNALGYSGTNSGGDMFIVSSIWRDNRVGIVPSSLDLELLPPQRNATIVGNLIVGNSSRTAPAAPLPSVAYGSGIIIVGGIGNLVENNVVADHPLDGIVIVPMYDKNFWPSRDNVIRNNHVFNSGRADLALGGPSSSGNCFAGNVYQTSAPAGLEHFHGCGGLRLPFGYDLTPLTGILGVRGAHADGVFPDYRTQPVPPPQAQMPGGADAPVRPAMQVFENLHFDLASVQPPAEAAAYLADHERAAPTQRYALAGLWRWSYHLLFVIWLGWLLLALRDLYRREDFSPTSRIVWTLFIVMLPFLGALLYFITARPGLSRTVRSLAVVGGIGIYLLILVSGALIYGNR
ncbi:MAG: right-handed parallel beta-helix repeat-containing protein, partial [Gemmatimonadota bacterium]